MLTGDEEDEELKPSRLPLALEMAELGSRGKTQTGGWWGGAL